MPNRSLLRTRSLKKGPFWRQWLLAKPSIKSHHSNWRQSSGNRRWRRTEGVSSSEGSFRYHIWVSCCPAAEVLIAWKSCLSLYSGLFDLYNPYFLQVPADAFYYFYWEEFYHCLPNSNWNVLKIPQARLIFCPWSFELLKLYFGPWFIKGWLWKLYILHFYSIYTS